MPSLETMEAATPKCPKLTGTFERGMPVTVRCGRPLSYEGGSNIWVCSVPGHGVVYRGEELAALANEEEAPAA